MSMAEHGLPHGGSVGYEIFDKTDAFGTSNFVQNINQVRALEGELERTIALDRPRCSRRASISCCRNASCSRATARKPSASIVLKMRGAERLASSQVAAIQHLVAAAVPGLNPDARLDRRRARATLLARGDGDDAAAATCANAEEMRVNYENRMARNVEELLERSVGPGKARVDVHADMDFDRITTNSESYDPDGQVVRSTQTVDRVEQTAATPATQPVTVSTNLPNGQTAAEQQRPPSRARARTTRRRSITRSPRRSRARVREPAT